jgi:hypothetical protein
MIRCNKNLLQKKEKVNVEKGTIESTIVSDFDPKDDH